MKIFTSSDYSIFKLSTLIDQHYKKVLKSIKENDYTKYQPILVNNKMEIVDGQNRFLACKELGIPFHFIVSDEIKNIRGRYKQSVKKLVNRRLH